MKLLKCKICGFKSNNLTSHITRKHNITGNDYKTKYNVDKLQIVTKEQRKKMSEISKELWKQEEYRKNYKVKSRYMKQYWIDKGYTELEAIDKISDIQKELADRKTNKYSSHELRKFSPLCIEYWMEKGYTKIESEKKISKINANASRHSKKFTGRKHSDKSKLKISNNMKLYIKNYGTKNWSEHFGDITIRSKGENDIYNYIKNDLKISAEANVDILYKNVDILYKNKIIEYFGDFWHCNPLFFNGGESHKFIGNVKLKWEKDLQKIKLLKKNGYKILIIWENDWKNNIDKIKNQIREFLND